MKILQSILNEFSGSRTLQFSAPVPDPQRKLLERRCTSIYHISRIELYIIPFRGEFYLFKLNVFEHHFRHKLTFHFCKLEQKATVLEYAINHVFDADTGETYDASILFKHVNEAYEFRRKYHESGQVLNCYCCKNRATVSVRNSTVHFKHYPNTGDCILKDGAYSIQEKAQIEQHYFSRESKRHKELKKAIGAYLEETDGVEKESLVVDTKFLFDQQEKRRPDVFCKFEERNIAFEIQLSPLPPKYIFKRHEFYKRNGIFLIWILDDFNVNGQRQTEKDIKHLNKHHNFFYFNDHSNSLVVQYKQGEIDRHNKTHYKWTHEFIELDQLTFDTEDFQAYYISFSDEQSQNELEAFKERHQDLLDRLRAFYKSGEDRHIPWLNGALDYFDHSDYKNLERLIHLGEDNENEILFRAVKDGKGKFIRYLMEAREFDADPNINRPGRVSLLQHVLMKDKLILRWRIIYLMFTRNYKLTENDFQFLMTFKFHQEFESERLRMIIRVLAFNRLRSIHPMETYQEIEGTVLVILSAKFQRIIGYRLNNFISLANNSIQYYKATYTFIEQAFKYYKLWDIIQAEDEKKTFKTKHDAFLADKTLKYNERGLAVLRILFPDVAGQNSQSEWIKLEWLGLS